MAVQKDRNDILVERPPVVVIMGHVDHGKTKILDYIRNTKVAEKEIGGITQSVGAYEIVITQKNVDSTQNNAENIPRKSALSQRSSAESNFTSEGRKITFIDTPGHEVFSQMRSRGAQAADIAVLVVAADDGVKPQTIEAIQTIKSANISFVVAINKIDKPGVDINKVKTQLSDQEVALEGWGGDIPVVEVSAKTGQGIDDLLDMILLLADMKELKASPDDLASGVVVESHLDSQRGFNTTLIILNGTLNHGDFLQTPTTWAKVKILENFEGKPIKQATFSSPVLVVGFEKLPKVGEVFEEITKNDALIYQSKKLISRISKNIKLAPEDLKGKALIKLIIKADNLGSLEALQGVVNKIKNPEYALEIISAEVGDLSEDDIKLANTINGVILLFGSKIRKELDSFLRSSGVKILKEDIIYRLIEQAEKLFEEIAHPEPEILRGKLEVLAIFGEKNKIQVIGGKVITGFLEVGDNAKLMRGEKQVGAGKIANLQKGKMDIKIVDENNECGILFNGPKVEKGDYLEVYIKK